jgi:hypothetical protein
VIGRPVPADDLPARYAEYLDRLTEEAGNLEVGEFAKYAGRLIHKLSFEEFSQAYIGYTELLARYRESLERGDTVDDLVLKLLREQSTNLAMPPPLL